MASDIDIANLGLVMLGVAPITSMTAANDSARAVNAAWDICLDAALRSHPWNFATTRAELAQLEEAPVYDWTYAYQLPSDCLRVLALNDDGEARFSGDDFRVEGRTLLCNVSPAKIRYIKRVTDPGEFDGAFCEAMACRLAATLAPTLAPSKSALMWQAWQVRVREARGANSMETRNPSSSDHLTMVR